MTKINLIFNENRNIQKEQSRLERMGLKDELAIVSDEHLLASAQPDQIYYDSQRKCGCFWSLITRTSCGRYGLSTGRKAQATVRKCWRSCMKF